jgi:hypothetical protein
MKFLNITPPNPVDAVADFTMNLGGNKVFKCPFCGWIMDRDFNAARNIFIMNVEDFIGDVYTVEEQKGIRNPVLQH